LKWLKKLKTTILTSSSSCTLDDQGNIAKIKVKKITKKKDTMLGSPPYYIGLMDLLRFGRQYPLRRTAN